MFNIAKSQVEKARMRRPWGVVLMLLSGCFVGCATEQPQRSTSWLPRLRPWHNASSAKLIQMEVALIERSVGDSYLNEQLWESANEQIIPLDRKDGLAKNGFRIGTISGMLPPGLQALLTSERSCANPRRLQRQSGDSTTLLLGLTLPRCKFQLLQEGEGEVIDLEQAQCTFQVVPSIVSVGGEPKVRLQFTPTIRHGEASLLTRPAVDRSGTYSWMLQEHRPTETFANLGWEVTLGPNEYLIVGGSLSRQQTLGHQVFIRRDEPTPVQRLLVLRAARMQPGLELDDGKPLSRTPPLAVQAAMTGSKE